MFRLSTLDVLLPGNSLLVWERKKERERRMGERRMGDRRMRDRQKRVRQKERRIKKLFQDMIFTKVPRSYAD